ncbi:MAG: IS4 transposase [Halioglobus sp.]|jgi:IS4 transposase
MIGYIKTNRKVLIGTKTHLINTLPETQINKIVSCKKYKCQYFTVHVIYNGIALKIFLVRIDGQSTWKYLVTTDKKLSYVKTMKLYQKRWPIEVFFKDAKQHLNLLGCQSKDFDAHVAHYSMVCTSFTALSLIKRIEGHETIGKLLINLKDGLIQQYIL